MNFTVNGVTPADKVGLGETVNFANGTNTTAVYDPATNTYKYNVADAPTFAGTVTAKGLQVNGDSAVTGNSTVTGTQTVTGVSNLNGGANLNGTQITGLLSGGTTATNAANIGDVQNAVAGSKTHFYSVGSTDKSQANYDNDGATGKNALAAGVATSATGESSLAIGSNATAKAVIITKNQVTAPTIGDIAIGSDVTAEGGIALGSNSTLKGIGNEVSIGNNNTVTNTNFIDRSSIAIGQGNKSKEGGVAIGSQAVAADVAIAMGHIATAKGSSSVSIGNTSSAEGSNSNALGVSTGALGDSSLAVGGGAIVTSEGGVALGAAAFVVAKDGVAKDSCRC